MKIYKDGELIADLPSKPKNLDCGCREGVISIVIGNDDVRLAKYSSQEIGGAVQEELCKAYLADAEEFNLPNE